MINSILVVCTGNICRSPIAEGLLKRAFQDTSMKVESAGIAALVGYPADPYAREVSEERGLDISSHVAKQITRPLLIASDLVLTLDDSHQNWITSRYPEFRGKTHKLGRWEGNRDIADPYRQPRAAFEEAYADMDRSIKKWLERLQKA